MSERKMTKMENYFKNERKFNGDVHEFKHAMDFLDALRLTNSSWGQPASEIDREWARLWMFRGQSSYEWTLTPSVWRRANTEKPKIYNTSSLPDSMWNMYYEAASSFVQWNRTEIVDKFSSYNYPNLLANLPSVLSQAHFELEIVVAFSQKADELGFAIPSLSTFIKQIRELEKDNNDDFLMGYIDLLIKDKTSEIWSHPLFAIAQHHGIPTRLLDWTRNSLNAAYFAVEDFVLNPASYAKGKKKFIAVYGVNAKTLKRNGIAKYPIIDTDYNINQFLKSQKGIFTCDFNADKHLLENGEFPNFEHLLQDRDTRFNYGEIYPLSKVFLLPTSETRELLRLLALEGVTKANLMPTLDNVARTLKLMWHLTLDE